MGYVVRGGVIGGLIEFFVEFAFAGFFLSDIQSVQAAHNFMIRGPALLIPMTAMMFLVVTIAIWFYAAVRPRFGSPYG